MLPTSGSDTDPTIIPSPAKLTALREALDQLLGFHWEFAVDMREQGLRRRFADLGIQPTNEAPGSVTRAAPSVVARAYRVIKQYYFDRLQTLFRVVFTFFDALTEAGGQRLLASRAGLTDLPPEKRPTHRVHHGPLNVPRFARPDFDAFEEAQGGSHVVGAQLIWWCAASERPWQFGCSPDLGWWVCTRIPWIEKVNGEFTVADGLLVTMKECASYLYDILAPGPARTTEWFAPRDELKQTSAGGRERAPAAVVSGSTTAERYFAEGGSGRMALNNWAIGLYDRGCSHLYQKIADRWVFRRRLDLAGRQSAGQKLLEGFLSGRGTLSVRRAFEALNATKIDPEELDLTVLKELGGREVFKRIKEEISHLRKNLRAGVSNPDCLPISHFEGGVGYTLHLQIGYSADDLDEVNLGTGGYQFITDVGFSGKAESAAEGSPF